MEKYGFVYLWYDRKHKRYYVGCHWGTVDDGYICSSSWMKKAYKIRPKDFKRRILKTNLSRESMYIEEQRYFSMIRPEEIKIRYYNLSLSSKDPWHKHPLKNKTVGQKISFSKTGKKTTMTPEQLAKRGKAISEAKKAAFAARGGMSEAHKQALKNIKRKPHTEEWKRQNSERMKEQWSSGVRKSKEHISQEQKDKISASLKGRKLSEKQVEFLRENNYKKYSITYFDGTEIIINGLKKYAQENGISYNTLHKCYLNNKSIKKHNILKISSI